MPENVAEIAQRIATLIEPGYREQLLARGLARGLIWRDGQLPPDAPQFSPSLSADLLDHGFMLLTNALRLRDNNGELATIHRGLAASAEALESASRHEAATNQQRGFYLVMAAAAFHIGGYAARAYSLFERDLARLNLATYERCLVQLMRRDLRAMRQTIIDWINSPANSDDGVTERLVHDDSFAVDEFLATALTRRFLQGVAIFEMALLTGQQHYRDTALQLFRDGEQSAGEINHVPLWWTFTLARHLCDDLWSNSLQVLLPNDNNPPSWPIVRNRFIQTLAYRSTAELDLWPSQVEAARRVTDPADDLVVALPTSAGKTRIAELCILRTLVDGKRVVYVTPLRALSAQIELGLVLSFRPLGYSVTSVYGASGVAHADLETLQSAHIVVATPEKLDFAIRQDPTVIDDVGLIILDEGHMIGLSEREIRYEMLVQRLLRRPDADARRLVCLSAVFSEGEAFDDFTGWLRSDAPGEAIRSTWRPTRQRPGRLFWNGSSARLELEVEGEHPFVPRFVELQDATGRRENDFPQDENEFLVASARGFLNRGQNVMVYCTQKRYVESTAKAFLLASRQGYFQSLLSAADQALVADALRIGEEWLGADHPAVTSLDLGVAVHHGSLPRAFLGEIETLLRRRVLRLCICSPTLAQGVDLSFSVLLFKTIYEYRWQTIKAKDFANIVGRVGRAFVDLDGLYVVPMFDTTEWKVRRRNRDFDHLIRAARQRQLESGVRLLIGTIIEILQSRLNCDRSQLAEYVLNQASTWEVAAAEDKSHETLAKALNELDTAILGIVDALDLPVDQLADYLDECLRSSYWQRRLDRSPEVERELQTDVIRGRARWIWTKTSQQQRLAFFAAGIGFKAGETINQHIDEIKAFLEQAEAGLRDGDLDAAVENATALAEVLYGIGPFVPDDNYADWKNLLDCWLRGTPLGDCAANDGVSFVQQNIVYRLVWAVEAARVHLQYLAPSDTEQADGVLAQCLTYGVPSQMAAVFMQAGLRSRTMATALVEKVGLPILDFDSLRAWIDTLRAKVIEPIDWETEDEQAEWDHFLRRYDHHHIRMWRDITADLPMQWAGAIRLKERSRVRVVRINHGNEAMVYSASLIHVGTTVMPSSIRMDQFTGLIAADGQSIAVNIYGY